MKHPYSKVTFLGLLLHAAAFTAKAQTNGNVGIGTSTPNASAVLDLTAPNKGLLVPRLDSAARVGIAQPATGLLVFQTSPRQGFYYYSGSGWLFLADKARGGDNLGNGVATTAVNLQGNALVGNGADLGNAVGVGVRADGGLNIGQNTSGNNVFLGYQAGANNTTGRLNQFSGLQSGYSNTTGNRNQFSGYQSGYSNTTGYQNQFSGWQAGRFNTTGIGNQFNGFQSGYSNTTGGNNQFSGVQSGFSNTTGYQNQFSGFQSGYNNTTGVNNQFSGLQSGYSNTTGFQNQFSGWQAGKDNTTGNNNQFNGFQSGLSNTTGFQNQFSGFQSGFSNTTGYQNQFSGYHSGYNNTTGVNNQFSGLQSGFNNTTGSNNWAFGYNAGPTTGNLTNAGAIGFQAQVSQSNSLVLGGTGPNAVQVGIGTTAPAATLDVVGSAQVSGKVSATATGAANVLAAGYGNVFGAGTLSNATSNVTVRRANPGEYVLTFTGPLAAADFGSTAVTLTLFNGPGFVSYTSGGTPGRLLVRTYNAGGTLTDRGFSFVVFQP